MANDKSDPANPVHPLKSQCKMVSFESCEIWFCGDKVVVDSCVPLPDLKLREFARPRILFEDASYYVSEKSQSSDKPVVYRYVLSPWPKNDESITRSIVLDEDYFGELMVERRRARLESMAFKALVIFYPFLGFLWSPQKRVLNRIGFESHSISSMSTYSGFMIGFSCGVFLVIFEFGATMVPTTLLVGMVLFTIDAVIRFDRLLVGKQARWRRFSPVAMILHRLKCGDLLSPSPDGYLECVRGRMPLAQELEERLRGCYVLRTRQPRELIFTYAGQPHRIGGQWFCPGCGVEAQELTPGDLGCPACQRSLVEFIESLIERHPHFDGTGGGR